MKAILGLVLRVTVAIVLVTGLAISAVFFVTFLRLAMAPPTGSGGIGAVSVGIGELLFEVAPFVTAQFGLRAAARRGLLARRVPNWHLIGSVALFVAFLLMPWNVMSPQASMIVTLVQVAIHIGFIIGASVLLVRAPRKDRG